MVDEELKRNQDDQETAILEIPQDEQNGLNEAPADEQAREAQSRYSALPYWRKVAAVFVIFVILVLLFLGGRAVYHHFHKAPYKAPAGTGGQAPKQPDGKTSGGSVTVPGTNGSGPGGVGVVPQGSGLKSQTGQSATQLPNSGPGDVIAIFTGTSLVAAGAHYIVTNRRAKRN